MRLAEWLRIVKGAGHLDVAMVALKRRHVPLRKDVGAWAKEAFRRAPVRESKAGPEPWFVGADGNVY
jgi:hypothetical protein